MKLFFRIYFIFLIIISLFSIYFLFYFPSPPQEIEYAPVSLLQSLPTPSPTLFPSPQLSPRPTRRPLITPLPTDSSPWGIARQTGEHTWTMKIGTDSVMANPMEILSALNAYRQRYGSQILTWDTALADYAQSRADYFYKIKDIDAHAGFNTFLDKEDGFNKLGFNYLGENISFGYQLNGVHLIEWVYAGDEPHNKNQLDSKWDHVGIGVRGTATCLIFATAKR